MTTRDELAERISQAGTIEIVDADLIDRNFSADERDVIVAALRLASRQEASVEELAQHLREQSKRRHTFENEARALRAEYYISKREG